MKACMSEEMLSVGPVTPTFSPSLVQAPPTCPARFGLWEMTPAAVIWSVQFRATPTSSPDSWSWLSPLDARRLLIRLRNSASIEDDALRTIETAPRAGCCGMAIWALTAGAMPTAPTSKAMERPENQRRGVML